MHVSGIDFDSLPISTAKKNKKLLIQYQNGYLEARNKLIESNLRLVLNILNKFISSGEDANDLFQVGCIGLVKAVDGFQFSHNSSFSSYAVSTIIGEIKRYLRDNQKIHIYRSALELGKVALAKKLELVEKTGEEPTVSELAKEIGADEFELLQTINALSDLVSFDQQYTAFNGENFSFYDFLKDPVENSDSWTEILDLKIAISSLSDRDKDIFISRHVREESQKSLGDKHGYSQPRICRIEKEIKKNLKNKMSY